MSDEIGQVLLYQTEDGQSRIEVRFEDGTVWLSQAALGRLYQTTPQNITQHIRAIYAEGELDQAATCKSYLQVRIEGARDVERSVLHYNLQMILAIGYRVRSHRGTQFRQWATARLSEYLVKGFVLDDERLKSAGIDSYFDELLERIRDIRASERLFYQKVLDIYATSIDYDPRTEISERFFAAVQNKMHWAAHGHTAAEVVYHRVNADLPNAGMRHVPKDRAIRKRDVTIAKNYLDEEELKTLNQIVNAYLEFAELQAQNRRPMHMADWIAKLDDFLRLSDRELLTHNGTISAETAKIKAEAEYDRYRALHASDPRPVDADFERAINQINKLAAETKRKPDA
jgi:hypothetical protein